MYDDGEARAVVVRPPSQSRTVIKRGQVCGSGEVLAFDDARCRGFAVARHSVRLWRVRRR